MTYRTCVGCAFGKSHCGERERVRHQVAGLGITSVKWRCKWKRPEFRPGDLVWATTVTDWSTSYDDGEPTIADFPAVAIQNFGSKLLVRIEPEAMSRCGDYSFSARNGGTGHCKITLSRVRKREGIRENVCHYCRQITGTQGHADYCASIKQDWMPATKVAPMRSAEL